MTGPGVPPELAHLLVGVDELTEWPGNARLGDLDAIADSLRTTGQYRPLVHQAGTGRVLIGNNTLRAARDRLGWRTVASLPIDVDDDQAGLIVLTDNRTADLGHTDPVAALALIEQTLAGVLDGTGYDTRALARLRAAAGPPGWAEYGDDAANDLLMAECPACRRRFPA